MKVIVPETIPVFKHTNINHLPVQQAILMNTFCWKAPKVS
jgi:hypothetical protein